MTSDKTEDQKADDPFWVHLTIYRPAQSYLYKTSAEDWDQMTEEQRQNELCDAAIELGWLGPFEYEETGRGDED